MQPAPALPPVTDSAGQLARAGESPVLVPTEMPVPAARAPSITWDPIVALHSEHLSRMSLNHQRMVEEETALHLSFLAMRESANQALLQFAGAAGVPGSYQAMSPPMRSVVAVSSRPAQPAPSSSPESGAPAPIASPNVETEPLGAPPGKPAGPTFSRAQLEIHASGNISELFGPQFRPQDEFQRQVRMPEPPLLLADRVIALRAEAGTMGLGSIWTETDVDRDSWYLHQGRMPAGILIEAGQADLMLISYLGVDLLNRGERVYRLLGCELTYHGALPRPGDTLTYDIHVDGHAAQGDVRLFFFHYDCHVGGRPQLTVKQGQAGFFTEEELDASGGCLWTPEEQEIVSEPRLDPPAVEFRQSSFDHDQIMAFADGDVFGCFGPGFERGQTHVRGPRIQNELMLLVDRVVDFDPRGGAWRRGYLRAEMDLSEDLWFFEGHFKNDPCMPGTLMLEGGLQVMAFYLAGLGHTLQRDGWRFQPQPETPFALQCRGQATPTSKKLVYELFVEEVVGGPEPTLFADLLCTVDGLKAFHARRLALQLVPDWPLDALPELLEDIHDPGPVAAVNGFSFGYASLLACAWGRPSQAFGPMYEVFDGPRRVARLPGPPYHFMNRVVKLHGEIGDMRAGASIELEYDIPTDAWYFEENGCTSMPFAVLLEAALQPCGWLASYVGSTLSVDSDLSFRNLGGAATVLGELLGDAGTLTTRVKMTDVSAAGDMIIESFDVQCFLGDHQVFEMETTFGFFPPDALAKQVGLPVSEVHQELLDRDSATSIDLKTRPAGYWDEDRPRLADPMLLMLDRVTGFWPEGGAAALGQLCAVKNVDPGEWFFKAHFFQDPVQPGSLGLESMIQLLQLYMLETHMDHGIDHPRFEPIALDRQLSWKYRGQVLPENTLITTTLEIIEIGRDDRGAFAISDASMWVDGLRIYQADGLGMRIVSDWLPGTIRAVYGARGVEEIAVREHVAAAHRLHPSRVKAQLPLTQFELDITRKDDRVTVSGDPGGRLDLSLVRDFWARWFNRGPWPMEDLFYGLTNRFVGRVVLEDPDAWAAQHGRSVLYMANHQVSIESLLFAVLAPGLNGVPTVTLAKTEHRTSWLGRLIQHCFSYPNVDDPEMMVFVDRHDPSAWKRTIEGLASEIADRGRSVMVHVEGTRALSARHAVETMSGSFLDMALSLGVPVVPVRFVGGLPVAPLKERIEFPVGMGKQDIRLGRPIQPEELSTLHLGDRKHLVIEGINSLGPSNEDEAPSPPDTELARGVRLWQQETGVSHEHATLRMVLAGLFEPGELVQRLVAAECAEDLAGDSSPEGRWLFELGRRLLGEG